MNIIALPHKWENIRIVDREVKPCHLMLYLIYEQFLTDMGNKSYTISPELLEMEKPSLCTTLVFPVWVQQREWPLYLSSSLALGPRHPVCQPGLRSVWRFYNSYLNAMRLWQGYHEWSTEPLEDSQMTGQTAWQRQAHTHTHTHTHTNINTHTHTQCLTWWVRLLTIKQQERLLN